MKSLITCVIAACLLPVCAHAQAPATNAALRYWMAFALMKDPPADKATADLLEQVALGAAPWDEARLGTILDANADALDIMQRATKLPTCDWGVEYELGSAAPIAHLARARALGRLNVVAGARLVSRGQLPAAVETWLAGVRFSQHVAQGGTLISLLSARLVLTSSLNALARVSGSLDATHRKEIEVAVRALPEAGFDWTDAMRREGEVLAVAKRMNPNLGAPMPSQAKVNSVAEEVRAERQRVLTAVTK
jgi:hypothetical protein